MFLSPILRTCVRRLHDSPTTKVPNQEGHREKLVHYITPVQFRYIDKRQLTMARNETQRGRSSLSSLSTTPPWQECTQTTAMQRVACSQAVYRMRQFLGLNSQLLTYSSETGSRPDPHNASFWASALVPNTLCVSISCSYDRTVPHARPAFWQPHLFTRQPVTQLQPGPSSSLSGSAL